MLDISLWITQSMMRLKLVSIMWYASQIETIKILGYESIGKNISFSMKQQIETVASIKSMQNFVDEPANTAKLLLRRNDFPKDLETLVTTAGLIFNYYGRRSICLMYAQDYRDDIDKMEFSEFIGTAQLAALDTFMRGWLNPTQIDTLGQFYFGMIGTKMKEYGLV